MRRVYLDSNILIAHYSQDNAEEANQKMVESSLRVLSQFRDVELCTSMWAITEMVNILISRKRMGRGAVAEIESRLISERRINDQRISFLDVSPRKDYDFVEFFYHVREGILAYHSGVGDVIHSVIMNNNGVVHILTFDDKEDFKKIPYLTVFHPRNVTLEN